MLQRNRQYTERRIGPRGSTNTGFHFFAEDDMKATWNGVVIAESDDTVVVEGNHYFPASALQRDFVVSSEHHTTCPWKGVASYYTLSVNGSENRDAVWYYPTPKSGAEAVAGRVAFWKGVQVSV